MQGIMQAGMGTVREEERGHARDHADWDGSSGCRLRWEQ